MADDQQFTEELDDVYLDEARAYVALLEAELEAEKLEQLEREAAAGFDEPTQDETAAWKSLNARSSVGLAQMLLWKQETDDLSRYDTLQLQKCLVGLVRDYPWPERDRSWIDFLADHPELGGVEIDGNGAA